MNGRPSIGSLFSGFGGLDSALEEVFDAEPIWFSEFDKAASKVLAYRYPDVPNLGDITKIDWSVVTPPRLMCGGSPCQDMSGAGKGAGMKEGTRSGLWSYMRDAIAALRPSLVVWENVRGSLSADADSDMEPCPGCVGGDGDGPVLRALGRVLGDLADIGYDAAWCGLRAADVGAPHGRFRVFVLAWPAADTDRLGLEWPGYARGGRTGPTDGREPALTLLPTPAVNDMGAGKTVDAWDAWTEAMRERHGNGNGHGASLAIEALRLLPTPMVGDSKSARNSTATRHKIPPTGVHAGDTLTDVFVPKGDALLPTPTAQPEAMGNPEGRKARAERSREKHGRPFGDSLSSALTNVLLPTPSVADGTGGHKRRGGARSDELLLNGVAEELARDNELLPTPRATDGTKGGPNQRGSSGDLMMPSAVQPVNFGRYTAAIERWEALTRPAPSPTEPTGKGGAQRLSPRFEEWMMDVADGFITDVPGVSHNDAIKMLGNGVVKSQAAAAIRYLLGVRARYMAKAAVA